MESGISPPMPSHGGNSGTPPGSSARSPRLPPSPIIVSRLPPASSLTRESLAQSELELDKQKKDLQRQKALDEALQDQEWEIQRLRAKEDIGDTPKRKAEKGKAREMGGGFKGFERPPQAWELYSAMDRHDIDFIMKVRDYAFVLLLQKNAGEFPIVYASRLGERHRDIVILIVGAMSR